MCRKATYDGVIDRGAPRIDNHYRSFKIKMVDNMFHVVSKASLLKAKLILFFVMAFVLCSSGLKISANEIDDFKKNALKKWNEQFFNADNYSCSFNRKSSELPPSSSDFIVSYPSNVVERREGKKVTIECNNSRYGFVISRKVDETEWQIGSLYKHERKLVRKNDWKFRGSYDYTDEQMRNGLYLMETTSSIWAQIYPLMNLPYLFQDVDFLISNLNEYTNDDGVEIIKFDFAYPVDKKENYMEVKEGTIELTKQNFSVVRIEHTGSAIPDAKTEIVVEYKDGDFPFPLVKKHVLKLVKNGKVIYEEESDYDFKIEKDLQEDRFKLSYYGLEEPIFDDEFAFDSRWYFLIVGLAFVVVAGFLARYRKRERNETV